MNMLESQAWKQKREELGWKNIKGLNGGEKRRKEPMQKPQAPIFSHGLSFIAYYISGKLKQSFIQLQIKIPLDQLLNILPCTLSSQNTTSPTLLKNTAQYICTCTLYISSGLQIRCSETTHASVYTLFNLQSFKVI